MNTVDVILVRSKAERTLRNTGGGVVVLSKTERTLRNAIRLGK